MKENDAILITFSDLKRLLLRHRSIIQLSAIVCGLCIFASLLLREPQYHAEATFKQASRQNDVSMNMKELFQHILPASSENGAMTIMRSNELLKNVVETMGLQVHCDPDFFLIRAFKRIWENALCELSKPLSDPDAFRFSNVSYEGEDLLRLYIKLNDAAHYQLLDSQKNLVAEAELDQAVKIGNASFTLAHIPQSAKKDQLYKLAIEPWIGPVSRMRKKFDVKPLKSDKTILQLSFLSRDRFFASAFLNQVMRSYQKYLRNENEEMCQSQLAYLHKRQDELIVEHDHSLKEHVAYLMENLGKNGYIGFAQELETLAEPKNIYTSKLFNIDVELDRLLTEKEPMMYGRENIQYESFNKTSLQADGALYSHLNNSPLEQIKREKIHQWEDFDLEQRRLDILPVQPLVTEIQDVALQIEELKQFSQDVEKGEEILDESILINNPIRAIAQCVKQFLAMQTPSDDLKRVVLKTQFVPYLSETISQLERRFEMLNEDLNLHQQDFNDFTGLSIETAQKLMVEYTQKRDNLQAEMKELIYLRDRLARPDFELSSLGVVINDPVTNELIHKASAIALQLKDNNNRSAREQERLLETLKTQKSFLSQYIFQTVDLKKLRTKLLENKIASLQERMINLLRSEKQLLGQKLKEINYKMGDLPEKWRRESLLKLKKEMGTMMIQAVAQLAESKSLAQSTFQVASKPLDIAIPPTRPNSPRIFFLSFFAAILGAAGCYFFLFCKALLKGLPVSEDNLKLSGFPVAGALSRYCSTNLSQMKESDLETLRHNAEFLSSHLKKHEAMTAVLIGGQYPDYSSGLAELLSMRGLKVLVIHYVFDRVVHSDQMPGLWQFIQGQTSTPPIRHHLRYDYLPSGGTTRHGAEYVSDPQFLDLLSQVKQKYDVVLVFSSADAAKAEGVALLKIADAALVTVQQERKEELFAYCDWSSKKGTAAATFVYAEE